MVFNINIVAVPVKHTNPPRELEERLMGPEGVRQFRLWGEYSHFHPGYLRDTVSEVVEKISVKYGDALQILSHELIIPEEQRQGWRYHRSELDSLGARTNEIYDESDLTIVLGGDHTGGYTLCHLPGVVVRVDAHSDDSGYYDEYVMSANYRSAVIDAKLKKGDEIVDHGPYSDVELSDRKGDIFDIDFDAFPEDLRILQPRRGLSYGHEDPEQLYVALKASVPRAIGFFEYYPEDDADNNGIKIMVNSIVAVVDSRINL